MAEDHRGAVVSSIEIRSIEDEVEAERATTLGTIDSVLDALRGLRYGTVTLTVHDGALVQIDRTEKLRLSPRKARR